MARIITLLSDFGLRDSYVGEMKASILSICQDANIVDITHEIPKFSIKSGAYILARSAPFFPRNTIHVAVVDPGVGGERNPIIIQTNKALFVGPDNGLLAPAANKLSIEHAYKIENRRYFGQPEVSSTFHGRDIFAPAAGHLGRGIAPSKFGPEIFDISRPSFVSPTVREDFITGEVVHIDAFGNIVTNIDESNLAEAEFKVGTTISVKLDNMPVFKSPFIRTYSDLRRRAVGLLVGSGGFLEIASNLSNAAKRLKVEIGTRVMIKKT